MTQNPKAKPRAKPTAKATGATTGAGGAKKQSPARAKASVAASVSARGRGKSLEAPRVVRLASGLTVASETMAEADSVTLGLWVRAGAGHEQEHESGLAHLLEHMVFKGTSCRNAKQIVEAIEDLGGWINAATGREATSYECKVPPEGVETAITLLAELFHEPLLQEQDLEAEREVVLQELGQAEDTPDDIIFDRFQEQAWQGHILGRPILGTKKSLRSFTIESLHDFRARLYEPSRLLLTAAGAIESDDLVAQADKAFPQSQETSPKSAKPKNANTKNAKTNASTSTNANTKNAEAALHFGCHQYLNELTTPDYVGGYLGTGESFTQLHIVQGFPAYGRRADAWPTLAALSQILGGGMSSRLFQSLREEAGLAYAVHSFVSSLSHAGLFGVYAGTESARGTELLARLNAIQDDLATRAPPVEEVDRARAQLRTSLLFSRERSEARMESLAGRFLAWGKPVPLADTLARLDAVTPEAIRTLAEKIFSHPPTCITLGPLSKSAQATFAKQAEVAR